MHIDLNDVLQRCTGSLLTLWCASSLASSSTCWWVALRRSNSILSCRLGSSPDAAPGCAAASCSRSAFTCTTHRWQVGGLGPSSGAAAVYAAASCPCSAFTGTTWSSRSTWTGGNERVPAHSGCCATCAHPALSPARTGWHADEAVSGRGGMHLCQAPHAPSAQDGCMQAMSICKQHV